MIRPFLLGALALLSLSACTAPEIRLPDDGARHRAAAFACGYLAAARRVGSIKEAPDALCEQEQQNAARHGITGWRN